MRATYPSDVSLEQFEVIKPMLESARKKTKPRRLNLYDVFCAVIYVITTGCQWRELPHDFPKWYSVYFYFQIWKEKQEDKDSILEIVLKKLSQDYRESHGRKANPSLLIADSQSVKNTDTPSTKGYDAGKKVSGVKRHIAVDTEGLPHTIDVTAADVGDRDGTANMFEENKAALNGIKKVLVDGGYSGSKFAQRIKDLIDAVVEVVKRTELHKFKVLPKRWIVERTFGWLEKFRRLWKNCERTLETSRQMIVLAMVIILLRRI